MSADAAIHVVCRSCMLQPRTIAYLLYDVMGYALRAALDRCVSGLFAIFIVTHGTGGHPSSLWPRGGRNLTAL
eukprot:406380-Pyramimonas_sp.AAC.1